MINGLLSNIGIDIAEKCGLDTDAFLKNAAILHENIFFHKGIYGNLLGLDYSNAVMAASWTKIGREHEDKLAANRGFASIFPDVREIWPTYERFNPYRDLETQLRLQRKYHETSSEAASEIMARTFRVSVDEVLAGKVGNTWQNIPSIVAQDAACLSEFRRYAPFAMGVFTEAHSTLLETETRANRSDTSGSPLAVLLAQNESKSGFPNFSAFSWEEIIELRRDPNISEFRKKMTALVSTDKDWGMEQMDLSELYLGELESFTQRAKPRPRIATAVALLGQIPTGPFPNPFSIISEVLNLKQQSDLARDFNWIYFVQRARQTCNIAP